LTDSSIYISCFAAAFGNSGQASYVEVVVGALLPNTRQL
jgi:hypothetical protein